MNLKFQIFISKKRKPLPITNILLVSIIGMGLVSYTLDYFEITVVSSKTIAILMFTAFSIFFIRAAIVRGKIRPYHGKLEGWIQFTDKDVQIDKEKIDIDKLEKFDFQFGSYYSEFIHHTTPIIEPWCENGTNNFIELTYLDGKKRRIQFQRMYEDQQKYLKPFLEYLHAKNLMSFLRLTDILGLSKYEEIQDYKKKIKN